MTNAEITGWLLLIGGGVVALDALLIGTVPWFAIPVAVPAAVAGWIVLKRLPPDDEWC